MDYSMSGDNVNYDLSLVQSIYFALKTDPPTSL